MAKTNELKALFFDVFGTCVDWRKTVTEALIDAAKQAGDTKMVLHQQHAPHKRHC
jgi:FMN phosphatase YigB (HAD superfamily)